MTIEWALEPLEVLEPRYSVPSTVHFSQSVVPALKRVQAAAVQELSAGQSLTMEHDWRLCLFFLFIFPYWQYASIWVP